MLGARSSRKMVADAGNAPASCSYEQHVLLLH